MRPIIVLFRQDLRLRDNPALHAAAEENAPILPLYIQDDETPGKWKMGGASRWWLHHSLKSLQKEIPLVIRKGKTEKVLKELFDKTGAEKVFVNRVFEPYSKKLPGEVHEFNDNLLFNPEDILNKQGKPFRVFTPFWNCCRKVMDVEKPLPVPQFHLHKEKSDSLEEWDLLPKHPNWAKDFSLIWEPGEGGAAKKIGEFLSRMEAYPQARDFPEDWGTSLLSPHLHFGEVSPRQLVAHGITEPYLRQLGWREFSYYILHHFPDVPEAPFTEKFQDWEYDDHVLTLWKKGKTGFPIIDAGMRQLWDIGWMHNRVRMLVASFLTKDLFQPWLEGARWFWDTLVDADLANNTMGWQWTAGCGVDAAPYFRIFNPITQGEKFDPEGNYVRRWIPELKEMPAKYIHRPWEAPEDILQKANVKLGVDYPFPIVDHDERRKKALSKFEAAVH